MDTVERDDEEDKVTNDYSDFGSDQEGEKDKAKRNAANMDKSSYQCPW